ncbi:hypothetical protein R1sor_013703 [Riccia sorocarpa]|uniref:Uncharacterized protein n=1 Tax=Riccia sorocarpa TaxID=122646 RepID=A0ABD3HDJ3_9MARC
MTNFIQHEIDRSVVAPTPRIGNGDLRRSSFARGRKSDELNKPTVEKWWNSRDDLYDVPIATRLVEIGLIIPNGDDGIDGMIITVANLMAVIGTKPHRNGYFREDGAAASGGCQGVLRERDQWLSGRASR